MMYLFFLITESRQNELDKENRPRDRLNFNYIRFITMQLLLFFTDEMKQRSLFVLPKDVVVNLEDHGTCFELLK